MSKAVELLADMANTNGYTSTMDAMWLHSIASIAIGTLVGMAIGQYCHHVTIPDYCTHVVVQHFDMSRILKFIHTVQTPIRY